jgi:hypothetical protein
MRIRLLAMAVIAAMIFAACGSKAKTPKATSTSSSSSTTSSSSSTGEASTTVAASGTVTTKAAAAGATTTRPVAGSTAAADGARAARLVFQQSDFPQGWSSTPPPAETDKDKAEQRQLETCIGLSHDDAHTADVKGNSYSQSQSANVSSEAKIVKDTAVYQQDSAAASGPKLQPCIKDYITAQATDSTGHAPTSVETASLATKKYGDSTVGVRATVRETVSGIPITAYLDLIFMGSKRAEVSAVFFSLSQPFDSATESSLLGKLGARLTA